MVSAPHKEFTMFRFLAMIAVLSAAFALNDELVAKLKEAQKVTEGAIAQIYTEWQVADFPNFLKGCSMHRSSWDFMKRKYIDKIMSTLESKEGTLVISFTGSSVAAGHDSPFNFSYPILVGDILRPAFAPMQIDVETRNVALGNNPCMPYNPCVKIFSGTDADVIHWEQSYNCGGKPIMEQFVRQAVLSVPTHPVLVFAESSTAHWNAKKCEPMPQKAPLTPEEETLLKTDPITIVADMNKNDFKRAWGNLHDIQKDYKAAGLQTFTFMNHEKYACLGPYIKDWEKGAAAWHPSKVAHRLRASQMSYVWLHIWKDAVTEMLSLATHRPIDGIQKDNMRHLETAFGRVRETPLHATDLPDNAICYTDYEPRTLYNESSLRLKVLSGLRPGCNAKYKKTDKITETGWRCIIYENLVHENIVKHSVKMGYKDYKYLMYGNKVSGPLSIQMAQQKEGYVFLCQTPGIWGQLPEGFGSLWEKETSPAVYLTPNVDTSQPFVFDASKSSKREYEYEKQKHEICVKLKEKVSPGSYALTVVPTSEKKIIVAWVIHS
jgi:hypothetical protein